MSDLTEKLKVQAEEIELEGNYTCSDAIVDAADKIERLQHRVKELEKACGAVSSYYSASLDYQPPYVALCRKALNEETK